MLQVVLIGLVGSLLRNCRVLYNVAIFCCRRVGLICTRWAAEPLGVAEKLLVPSADVVACDAAEDLTQREGWSCDRSEEVLSAKRDRRDGVEGPTWPAPASALLPPEIGAKTVNQMWRSIFNELLKQNVGWKRSNRNFSDTRSSKSLF